MLSLHDKTKALFEETSSRQFKIKKAKIVAFCMEDRGDTSTNHYILLGKKMPAHFVLDSKEVVKYSYSTTNVFKPSIEWNNELLSSNFIEEIKTEMPDVITGQITPVGKILDKGEVEGLSPKGIVVYAINDTLDNFYKVISQDTGPLNFHYFIDDVSCYVLVSDTKIAHHMTHAAHQETLSIVVFTKNRKDKAYDRASKLVRQIKNEKQITVNSIEEYEPENPYILKDYEAFYEKIIQEDIIHSPSDDESANNIKQDGQNPGDHIILIKMLYNKANDFTSYEEKFIQFVAEYLYYHNLDISSFWRLSDLLKDTHYTPYYNSIEDFEKLLSSIDQYINQLKKGAQHIEIVTTGMPHRDLNTKEIFILPFEKDLRSYNETAYFLTNNEKAIAEDYVSSTIGSSVALQSKFEDTAGIFTDTISFATQYYEPIYPDLTVPPRNTSLFYNKGLLDVKDILKQLDEVAKPVIGKIPNMFDAYPVDDKISQLEMHAPMVTLEYENGATLSSNQLTYMLDRYSNTEKRLVRIENILSTVLRYQARLASRVQINCVYYGGQSAFGKIKYIE